MMVSRTHDLVLRAAPRDLIISQLVTIVNGRRIGSNACDKYGMDCTTTIIRRVREWIIEEEIRRVRHDPGEFQTNAGYLLALSNLIELLHEIEIEGCSCELKAAAD